MRTGVHRKAMYKRFLIRQPEGPDDYRSCLRKCCAGG
jgi:hypothetical protein